MEVIVQIRCKVNTTDSGVSVKALKIRDQVLVEFEPGSTSKDQFGECLRFTQGDFAPVRCLKFKAKIKPRDMDDLTIEVGVTKAVTTTFEKTVKRREFIEKKVFNHIPFERITNITSPLNSHSL